MAALLEVCISWVVGWDLVLLDAIFHVALRITRSFRVPLNNLVVGSIEYRATCLRQGFITRRIHVPDNREEDVGLSI